MGDITQRNRAIGLLGTRLVIGCLSAEIGLFKLFINGLPSQMKWFMDLNIYFPMWLLWGVNIYCAVIEFVCGLMLIFGVKRDWALWGILSVLVIVNFGHGLQAAVWDINQMATRVAFLAVLLLVPAEWDVLRLESIREAKALFLKGSKAN